MKDKNKPIEMYGLAVHFDGDAKVFVIRDNDKELMTQGRTVTEAIKSWVDGAILLIKSYRDIQEHQPPPNDELVVKMVYQVANHFRDDIERSNDDIEKQEFYDEALTEIRKLFQSRQPKETPEKLTVTREEVETWVSIFLNGITYSRKYFSKCVTMVIHCFKSKDIEVVGE